MTASTDMERGIYPKLDARRVLRLQRRTIQFRFCLLKVLKSLTRQPSRQTKHWSLTKIHWANTEWARQHAKCMTFISLKSHSSMKYRYHFCPLFIQGSLEVISQHSTANEVEPELRSESVPDFRARCLAATVVLCSEQTKENTEEQEWIKYGWLYTQ